MHMPMIAQRVFNTPLMVDPAKGHAFLSGLGARIVDGRIRMPVYDGPIERAERASRVTPRTSILGGEAVERTKRSGRRMYAVRDGVAIIEVTGTLVHRGDWIGESSGATSYEGLSQQIQSAAEDPGVRGIALEIDTFGGEVAGVFDLADTIRAARERKPVWGFVAEAALSAGYALASQADRIVLPRTGEVGSIGVLMVHADYSERLADEGIRVTMIYAGAHKVDGNPYEPLPESVRDELQAEVEDLRRLFASTVTAGRKGMSADSALATDARVFRGQAALEAGLADQVIDLRSAFASFVAQLSTRPGAPQVITATGSAAAKEASMLDQEPGPQAENDAPAEAPEPQAPAATDEAETAPAETPRESEEPTAARQIDRAAAAALAEIGTQASRLGVKVDVAQAIREGMSPDALRARVLEQAASRSDAAGVDAGHALAGQPKESPIVAKARKSAEQARNH